MHRRQPLLAFASLLLAGCGGGVPLLHPAHVLPPNEVRAGAGLSGQIAMLPAPPASSQAGQLEALTVSPAIAPWVSARMGLGDGNEGGLTYSGRSIRLDARHAFSLGGPALSVGLGASALAVRRPGEELRGGSIFGGGIDVPVLLGVRSTSDLYAIWLGPRAGIEFLRGRAYDESQMLNGSVDASARHIFAGFVIGARAGFRHVHVALELDGAYHRADGSIGATSIGRNQLSLTPGGALLIDF
jgi:hypothetical protein